LQHPANRQALEFVLRDGGYDTIDHDGGEHAKPRHRMDIAGWVNRRSWAKFARDMQGDPTELREPVEDPAAAAAANTEPPPETMEQDGWVFERGEPLSETEVAEMAAAGRDFDPTQETHYGIVMGMALACYRMQDGADNFFLLPGDDVEITVPTAGTPLKMVPQLFTIVDFYESKLSEYDSNLIFAPLASVQRMRETLDSATGIGSATSIQIKLHNEADSNKVRDLLRAEFPAAQYGVQTWRDKQGPLLEAIKLEITILNVLLFLIIAVAGFGILAIFYMIVVEKTRDIGILKSLGAPRRGILQIFLAYGLGLGIVGGGTGMVLGLLLVANINYVASQLTALIDWFSALVGLKAIDTTIYYVQEIPVLVNPLTVVWIVFGAMFIAVAASVLPARRAAALHPVDALRNKK
jgi:lipoprotein-releasing system permease protein